MYFLKLFSLALLLVALFAGFLYLCLKGLRTRLSPRETRRHGILIVIIYSFALLTLSFFAGELLSRALVIAVIAQIPAVVLLLRPYHQR